MARAKGGDKRGRRQATPTERCPVCKKAIRHPGVGRRRCYCSHACRQVAYRLRNGEGQRRRLVRLVQADAREFLVELPSESVDLILTDPPYAFDRGDTYFREWFAELPDAVWPQIFAELYRVLCPNSHAYVFANRRIRPAFEAAAEQAGFHVHQTLIWDKKSIGLGNGTWRPQHEYICFFSKGSRPGNSRSCGDVLRAPRPRGYPTEKPVTVLKRLIAQSSKRGQLVLDPFCGSGNVGKSARQLGRRAVLCDVDAGFAARRLRLGIDQFNPAKG